MSCVCIGKPEKDKVFIYTLSDPVTNEIRYVGKTFQKLRHRYADHISFKGNRNKLNYHSKNWIKSLTNQGLTPKMEILEIVDKNVWQKTEMFYISYFKYIGVNLTNHQVGGEIGNEGRTWKVNKEKLKTRTDGIKKNRIEKLVLYDLKGNVLKEYKNLLIASDHLNIKIKCLRNSIIKKTTIKNQFILLKNIENFNNIKLKRRCLKIKISNNIENLIFNNQKSCSEYLKINLTTLNLILNNKHINNTNYKIEKI